MLTNFHIIIFVSMPVFALAAYVLESVASKALDLTSRAPKRGKVKSVCNQTSAYLASQKYRKWIEHFVPYLFAPETGRLIIANLRLARDRRSCRTFLSPPPEWFYFGSIPKRAQRLNDVVYKRPDTKECPACSTRKKNDLLF